MMIALKISVRDRIKWAVICPSCSLSHHAAFPIVCSAHIGANLSCLSRLRQLSWQYYEYRAGTLGPSLEPEKAFSPQQTEISGGNTPLEQRHQTNMTYPWFCLLQDFPNLFWNSLAKLCHGRGRICLLPLLAKEGNDGLVPNLVKCFQVWKYVVIFLTFI